MKRNLVAGSLVASFVLATAIGIVVIHHRAAGPIGDEELYSRWVAAIESAHDRGSVGEPPPGSMGIEYRQMIARGKEIVPLLRSKLAAYLTNQPGARACDRRLAFAVVEIMDWDLRELQEAENGLLVGDTFQKNVLRKLDSSEAVIRHGG